MKKKKRKTKMHRVSMSSNEMCFALFAFRKVLAHDDFMPVRMRLSNALLDMGLVSRGEEFVKAMRQYVISSSNTTLNQTK